jgi:hypothetical protein
VAFYDTTFYCNAGDQSTTGHYAVAKRPQNTAVVAGQLCRQFTAPAVGSERVFVCIVAGTTANVTDATWVLTRGAKTTDGTATWQECTGMAAVNGDLTNTVNWTQAKAIGAPTLGAIIQRNNGASYWICTTAGSMGASEPAWPNNTAGTTQADGTTTWTCLGVVGNFTGGQAPHARLANACTNTWFAAGNTVYVGDNHAESQATAITITPTLSQPTVGKIICHNHSGSYPPTSANLATTATISTTAAVNINFTGVAGALYVYGLTFIAGVGQSGTASIVLASAGFTYSHYFDNCNFKLATTSGLSAITLSSTSSAMAMIWNNCQVSFAATSQVISAGTINFIWQNTGQILVTGSSVPNNLLQTPAANYATTFILEALDLSQIVSIFAAANASVGNWLIKDCKLNASATFPTPSSSGQTIQIVRADGSATAYKSARYVYEGSETTETSITRIGGAVDAAGQAQSRKIVTTSNPQWLRPFKAEPYAIWNPTTGADVTVTVFGTINAGALPNNDDIWLEVEYLGSSSVPIGTIVASTKANLLAANAAVSSDGSTWNGGGSGAGWSPFKLTITLSSPQPGMAGYLHARVRAAKPSTTVYIDPKIVLT